MAFMKYLVPALAVAGAAVAQGDSCKGPKTIENPGDASALASCTTFEGDIEIAAKVPKGPITLEGIQEITGSLTCKGAQNLTSLAAPDLESIGDTFLLSGAIELRNLQFDSLTEVGALNFEALPNLQQLSFTKGVSKAKNIRISNTDLANLKGIALNTVGDMEISNNLHLKEADVAQITNVTGFASFSANHEELKISFPNLESALNMTFRNVSSVEIPSLKKTQGLLGFYSNFFEELAAPNLTSTGDLVFADNSELTNISLPILETVKGAFQIANNTELKAVDGVPKLKTVYGALDFTGSLEKVELPGLDEVRGEFNLQTTQEFNCDALQKEVGRVGDWVCKGKVANPQTKDGESGGNGKGNKPTGAAVPLNIPSGMTMMALIGGALGFAL
ncbi:hypothetical protein AJ79_01752 [Helicocarpus griseus UAMH5409]|uniref:Receptor L-domain domain-containing protein n=1 Tax=Helicocarpus griseus UAMH5409 TaxID=1447875 RepID=A0A2B7Y5Z1_9EURO|nr:hypothetical protein AJ79_01752 [Helicocarpus griseus UAMH5409]